MRILCFGDSNTYGYDPRGYLGDRYSPSDRWPHLLAAKTGWDVYNAGFCGQEIPNVLPSRYSLSEYDALLIMLGTNDLLQGRSVVETSKRMEHFVRTLLSFRKSIFLITPPPMARGTWVPTDTLLTASVNLADSYRKAAESTGVSFIDTRSWETEIAFDGVHFTEAGHHSFANHLYHTLHNYI